MNFIDYIKGLIQPFITVAFVSVFLISIMSGAGVPELLGQITIGILAFWFGDKILNKVSASAVDASTIKAIQSAVASIPQSTTTTTISTPATTTTTTTPPTTTPPQLSDAEVPPPIVQSAPIDVDAYANSLSGTVYKKYDDFNGLFDSYKLTNLPINDRISTAKAIITKAIKLADDFWKVIFSEAKGARLPIASDFIDKASLVAYEKILMDAIPGCQYLSETQDAFLAEYKTMYNGLDKLDTLKAENIKWFISSGVPNISTVMELIKLA